MKVIAFSLLLTASTFSLAQDFAMDEYLVRWMLLDVGNSSLRVLKTPDRSFMNIYRPDGPNTSTVRMSGADAAEIGSALARLQEIHDSQMGAVDVVSEEISAGNFTVTFRTSRINGFSVVIQENQRFTTNGVTLPLNEALAIQPYLLQANELLDHLNNSVDF